MKEIFFRLGLSGLTVRAETSLSRAQNIFIPANITSVVLVLVIILHISVLGRGEYSLDVLTNQSERSI